MNEAKSKAKPKKVVDPDLKYVPLTWAADDFPGCCGMQAVYSFNDQTHHTEWGYRTTKRVEVPKKFKTREEQAEDGINRWEKEAKESLKYAVGLTLVWKYKNSVGGTDSGAVQYPALHEALLKHGYTLDKEWMAPRHGNILRMYTRVLEGAEEAYREDYDNEWDDD